VLERDGSVVRPAVIGPGDPFFIERFADGAGIDGRDGLASCNSPVVWSSHVDSAVWEEARVAIINQVEVSGLAFGIGLIRKRSKVIADWSNARLRGIAALGEVPVEIYVHSVLVV
jgi:hypothetical protein